MVDFLERLEGDSPLLLDGATGTELNRRGVDTRLPLWSAWALIDATDELLRVHRDYVDAGAEVITANTFRTHRRTLSRGGHGGAAAELTRRAVDIARRAIGGRSGRFVAGSMAPLEDCYRPDLVPADGDLVAEHAEMAQHLHAAGVDLILVETMNTVREAKAATRAALATGLPTVVGLVCDRNGRLLSGESPASAAEALASCGGERTGPRALAINCTPAPDLERALETLKGVTSLPLGAYANVGYADDEQGWVNTDSVDPRAYAAHARRWLQHGARLIGGCCGTGPAHIQALRRLRDARAS